MERREKRRAEEGKKGKDGEERERERKITIPYAIRGWPDAASCARSDHRFLPSFLPPLFPPAHRNCAACPTNEPCSDTETRVSTFFGKLAKLFPCLLLLRPRVTIRVFFSPFLSSPLLRDTSLDCRNVASSSLFFVVGRRSRQSRSRTRLLSFSSPLVPPRVASLPCTRTSYSLSPSLPLSFSLAPSLSAHRESCYSRIPVA